MPLYNLIYKPTGEILDTMELPIMPVYQSRPLYAIARDIRRAWPKVNFAAVPYLDAMGALNSINDRYMHDDGRGIVRYFLANAAAFRGDTAKALKAELKALL